MAIDFPNSPSINDSFTVGNATWIWNGTAWVSAIGSSNAFGNVVVSGQSTVVADVLSDSLTLASTDLAITTNDTTDTVTLTLATVNSNVGSFGTSIDIPVITANGKGLVTAVSTQSVRVGSTTQTGVLQLTDSFASTSTTTAATPAAVKSAYDLANAALARSGGTMTGSITLRAGTATAGTAPIYLTSGTNLTSAAAGAVEWDGTSLFITQTTGPTRKTVAFTDSNITGTAANVTGTVAVANGGTGQTSYTNGQLLIGNTTGNTLTKATLTGTTDQVIVTNGAGTITLSLPQSINTTSTPTFATLTLSQATGAQLSLTGATSNWIQWTNVGIAAPAFTTRSAGTKLVLFPNIGAAAVDYALGINANTLWFSVPTSTQLFNWYAGTTSIMTLSGSGTLTATTFAGSGASLTSIPAGQLSGTVAAANGGTGQTSYLNGELLIGNGTGLTKATLTGTANRVTVTNGAGSITLSLPQDIHTGASPTFAGLTASGTVNLQSTVQRNGTAAKMLVSAAIAQATATISPTSTTYVANTGASITASVVNGDTVIVRATFDLQCDGNGTTGVGALFIGGTAQASPLVVLANVNPGTATSGVRSTLSQTYIINNTTTGNVTYDLRTRCGAGFTSGVQARLDHTAIVVEVYR